MCEFLKLLKLRKYSRNGLCFEFVVKLEAAESVQILKFLSKLSRLDNI